MKFSDLLNIGPGDGDPKKKKEHWAAQEMRVQAKKNLPYDNKPMMDVLRNVSKQTGVDPALLLSSAFQEGMNEIFTAPDKVSGAYVNAEERGEMTGDYPVDGFYNYGIDQFDKYLPGIQKDLPAGFEQRYKMYKGFNDQTKQVKDPKTGKITVVPDPQPINTVAFRSNEDALLVKALILKNALNDVDAYSKQKGVVLDDESKKYLALAKYNSQAENFPIMFDELAQAKDKHKFITEGQTRRKGVHTNIYPRIENMAVANELLNPPTVAPVLPQPEIVKQ